MEVLAALMTAKQAGAIATVMLAGSEAEEILREIFVPASKVSVTFETGKVLVGRIIDGEDVIDEVTIGCEGEKYFAINTHANPIITTTVMKLLKARGTKLVTAERMMGMVLSKRQDLNSIGAEAIVAGPRAKTIEAVRIINSQRCGELNEKAESWLSGIEDKTLEEIKAEAREILSDSEVAKLIIDGVRIVLTGPANSGKSTLLNCLAGKEHAIVSEVRGTTRDYVTAECQVGPVAATFFDTAGLDRELIKAERDIEHRSQMKTVEVLENTDLILLVLDNSRGEEQFDTAILEKLENKKIFTVINKSDAEAKLDRDRIAEWVQCDIEISAKLNVGIDELKEKMLMRLGVKGFDVTRAVCFTERQERIMESLLRAETKEQVRLKIQELLNGSLTL